MVAPNNNPNPTQPTVNCGQVGASAGAASFTAAAKLPSPGNIVGGGVIAIVAHVLGASNPVSITLGFLNVFRENIGNALIGTAQSGGAWRACVGVNGGAAETLLVGGVS